MRGAFAAHPRGEAFIEPEIVPPRHGYKISEPHVRHLMGQYFIDILFGLSGRTLRTEQKPFSLVGDPAPVFHRPPEAARNSNLIQLRQGIRHAEIIVVVLQNLR